jgi:hypothetical protein
MFSIASLIIRLFLMIMPYFQPSSCLSDQEGDDIYDFTGKYRTSKSAHQAKALLTPQG